jgi:hypothetical protein
MKVGIIALTMGTIVLNSGLAHAAKKCTNEPKSKWMSIADFKTKKKAEGYNIRKFKQPGSCYEIYGTDKDGKDSEIYFSPVDGSIVKKK